MLHALQFLTILPVRGSATPPGRSAWAFPFVGAVLGLGAAAILPLKFGPLLIVILLGMLTGGLHEDGLADVCDALRAYRSRERMLEIMKDPRIGVHGAFALIASFAFRWQALAALQGNAWLRLPAAYGISRAMMVLLAGLTPATGGGLGRAFGESLPRGALIVVAIQILLLAGVAGWPAAALICAANAVVLVLLRWWFMARIGGFTGDCLGATCQISEAITLGVLAWV